MEKRKKIYLIIFSAVVLITAFVVYWIVDIQDNLSMLEMMYINDIDLTETNDGDYYGEYSVFPVSAKLIVTVVDHQITAIEIIEHKNGKGEPAEAITDDVIQEQSIQIDSIAGATYSSKVILLAIQDALD